MEPVAMSLLPEPDFPQYRPVREKAWILLVARAIPCQYTRT